jgi:DNA-binding beta-propeller fold protein YncE
LSAGLFTIVTPASAQPYGYITPVPANSLLRSIAVSGQKSHGYTLPQQGLVSGVAVNSAATLLYTANSLASGAEVVVTSIPAGTQVATIPLTFTPYSILMSPNGEELYVAGTVNFTSAFICVINTASNSATATLTISVTPDTGATFPMAITPEGSALYLAAGGLVRVITSTLAVTTYPSPSSFSQGIAVTPDGSQLWFSLNNEIKVLNAKSLALITTISADGSPYGGNGLLITPDGTEAILANNGLRAFSTTTYELTASLSTTPFVELGYLSPGPDSDSFLVTSVYSSLVLRVSNSFTLLNTYVQNGAATVSVAVPGGEQILAANGDETAVGTVNAATGEPGPSITVGCQAGVPAINSARNELYVPSRCSQDITVLNLAGHPPVQTLIHGPVFATKVLVSPDGSRVYAADLSGIKYSGDGVIEVLDVSTGTLITTLTGSPTVDIALSADGSQLYIDDNGSSGSGFSCPVGGVCIFDTTTFALTTQIPNLIGPLALSQDGNTLYCGPSGSTLSAVNTSTFAVTALSLPFTLTSLGAVAVSPAGNSAVVFGNGPDGGAGYLLNTSTNQFTGSFPVPGEDLLSAAFAPNGNSIWFLAGPSSSESLVEESFPAGQVVSQTPAEGSSISFTAAF